MSRTRKDGGVRCGSTRFVLVRSLVADRVFTWKAATRCLQCARLFILNRGEAAAVLKVGNEITGAVCPACLTPESRQLLQSMRGGEAAR
jgi:hypothetical protein